MYRQLHALSARFEVTACGLADPHLAGVRFIQLESYRPGSLAEKSLNVCLLFSRNYEAYYWRPRHVRDALSKIAHIPADIVIVHDLDALPLAVHAFKESTIILDAHEYTPREFEDNLVWRIFFQKYRQYLCATYIPRVHRMITVCRTIADEYRKHFNVSPIVVTNAPYYEEITPTPTDRNRIRMIYHGAAIPSRRIEKLIMMIGMLDNRFSLHLMLVPGNVSYIKKLKNMANGKSNIEFVAPVAMKDIPKTISKYDIGLFFIEPSNFNYLYALPNKFFEFIQARLALAGGPSPEMAGIVRDHGCGVVAKDFRAASLAEVLQNLTAEQIDDFKKQSHAFAPLMSAEKNAQIMLDLFDTTIPSGTG